MKKIFLFLILIFSKPVLKSQNLVPNPSFEDTIACPTGAAGIILTPPWNTALGTPDYFNACASSCRQANCSGTPCNWAGNQVPFSGNSYTGLFTYRFPGFGREALIVPLATSMEIGKKYYFSCYIVRADDLANHGASNNFGFRFSTVEFDGNYPVPVDNFSHYRETTIITDSVNWTRIEGNFIADSVYNYLMIGNFYDNVSTDTLDMLPIGHPWNYAYYFIDDVCVTLDSGNCTLFNSVNQNNTAEVFSISPNPFNNYLDIVSTLNDASELIIYDVFGRVIISKGISKSEILYLPNLVPGIYLYVINNNRSILKTGKLLKQ